MNYAIDAKDLSKNYGTYTVLKKLNLQVPEGSIFGIIGSSGAGKTTLLKLLSTLEKPDSGSIAMLGQFIPYDNKENLRLFRQNIGVIFQAYHLLNSLDVFENVALPLRIVNKSEEEIEESVTSLLNLVGLESKKHLHPSMLSGGQKQRVAIARALVSNPKILLCDEPTAALDPENTHSVLKLFEDIRDRLKTTVILVTHEIGLIGGICDQIAIVHNGVVVESGPVQEIFFEPKEDCTKRLINPKKINPADYYPDLKISNKRLFHLRFMGDSAKEPLLATLIKEFGIHPNILAGSIDKVGHTTLGHLIVSFDATDLKIDEALVFLKSRNVHIDEIL